METNREPILLSIETLNRYVHPGVDFTKPCPYSLAYLQAIWEGREEEESSMCISSNQTVRTNHEELPVDKKRKKDDDDKT